MNQPASAAAALRTTAIQRRDLLLLTSATIAFTGWLPRVPDPFELGRPAMGCTHVTAHRSVPRARLWVPDAVHALADDLLLHVRTTSLRLPPHEPAQPFDQT